MAKFRQRQRKGRTASPVSLAPPPWDMGATGPANRVGLELEDATEPDPGRVVHVKLLPSLHILFGLFSYDPFTGDLVWKRAGRERLSDGKKMSAASKAAAFNLRYAGKKFGAISKAGYRTGGIGAVAYKAHRIAWKMATGKDPDGEIDHINGDRSDNRIENLRVVSTLENTRNQKIRSTNVTGFTGVSWHALSQKWRAAIGDGGKKKHIGYFGDFGEAVQARLDAERRMGYHENHGKRAGRNPTKRDELAELGLITEAARMGMTIEDVKHFDQEKGHYVGSPNSEKRVRRVDMLETWHRKGVISTAGYNAAEKLRDAFAATQKAPGWPDNDRVQSSPKPDHAVTIQIDRLSAYHRIAKLIPPQDSAIIATCVLQDRSAAHIVTDGRRPYYGPGHKAGLTHLREALDRLADKMQGGK